MLDTLRFVEFGHGYFDFLAVNREAALPADRSVQDENALAKEPERHEIAVIERLGRRQLQIDRDGRRPERLKRDVQVLALWKRNVD